MQSFLVKQHVLEALSIHEEELRKQDKKNKRKRRKISEQSASQESSGDGEGSDDDETSENAEEEKNDKVGVQEKKSHTSGSQREDSDSLQFPREDDLQFDDHASGSNGNSNQQQQNINEEELLLDNYLKKTHSAEQNRLSDEFHIIQQEFTSHQIEQLHQKQKENGLMLMKQQYDQKQKETQQKVKEDQLKTKQDKQEEGDQQKQQQIKKELNSEQAIQIIKTELNQQTESLQERLRRRKENALKKQQEKEIDSPPVATQNPSENHLPVHPFNGLQLQSPNLSNMSPQDPLALIQVNQLPLPSPVNKIQLSMNTSKDDTDNMILKNLVEGGSDIEPDDQPDIDDAEEDDPELLQELEKRKEEITEEFLDIAFQKKQEAIEEVKADFKKNKVPKDVEKKRLLEVSSQMDQKRKQGLLEIKKKLNQILFNDSISLTEKMTRLQDTEQIKAFMQTYFSVSNNGAGDQQPSPESKPQLSLAIEGGTSQ